MVPGGHGNAGRLLGRVQCELQLGQPAVQPALADQVGMAALLDDAAVVHDQDARGALHGRQSVGDDDRGAVGHHPLQRLLHGNFALGIERAGRLVEQQDGGIAQDGPSQRDALALAARQGDAALADAGVVALLQRGDEGVSVRGRSGANDLIETGIGSAVADVLGEAVVEQGGILRHEGEAAPAAAAGRPRRSPRRRRSPRPTAGRRSAAAG